MPTVDGVLELGSTNEFRLLPGSNALNLAVCMWSGSVDKMLGYVERVEDISELNLTHLSPFCNQGLFVYAIEWRLVGKNWRVVNHFNPYWRIQQMLKKGHV